MVFIDVVFRADIDTNLLFYHLLSFGESTMGVSYDNELGFPDQVGVRRVSLYLNVSDVSFCSGPPHEHFICGLSCTRSSDDVYACDAPDCQGRTGSHCD